MELERFGEALDGLIAAGPSPFADAASMDELQRLLTRFEAFVTAATAGFDRSADWAVDGARNAAAWLTARTGISRSDARRRIRRGRFLEVSPVAADAWIEGRITGAHIDALGSVVRRETLDAYRRDESMLVDQAADLAFSQFTRALGYWESLADQDGSEEAAERRRSRRDVSIAQSYDGMWFGSMLLDPVSGAIVAAELRRLEDLLYQDDYKEAQDRLGRDPEPGELRRTPNQRRADALVEMATRSATMPADGHRPAPLVTVLVGYETLHGRICELANGTPITPGSLLPWLEPADIERAVFTPSGRVEVSATCRLFTGALRRAIELRDRQCQHPYCEEPAERCEVDHIQEWAAGGPTTYENGRLLCGFHNRLRNQRPPPEAA